MPIIAHSLCVSVGQRPFLGTHQCWAEEPRFCAVATVDLPASR
jgi:hypothetical protein